MFYEITRFPEVYKINLIAANTDRICDAIPIVSTITNVIRLALKILTRVGLILTSSALVPVFILKGLVDFTFRRHKYPLFHNFDLFLKTVFKIQSLWMSNFFLYRYFDKSNLRTICDMIPLIGLFNFLKSKDETQPKFLESKLIARLDAMSQSKQLFASKEAYPYYLPEGFLKSKALYLANFRLNPTKFQEIPEEFLSDRDFVLSMLDSFCVELAYKNLNFSFEEAKSILSGIIERSHKAGILEEITLPVETLFLNPRLIDLCSRYPFLLWMFANIEFVQNKKVILPIINQKPHVVTRLSHHFLKLHPAVFHKAISLNVNLAKAFDNHLLVHAFTIKEGLQQDPLFQSVCKIKRGFLHLIKELLHKKKLVAQLRN